jgi:hypothetical protein
VEWDTIRKLVQYVQKTGLKELDKRPYVALSGKRVWACEENFAFEGGPAAQVFVCDLRPGVASLGAAVAKIVAAQSDKKERAKA